MFVDVAFFDFGLFYLRNLGYGIQINTCPFGFVPFEFIADPFDGIFVEIDELYEKRDFLVYESHHRLHLVLFVLVFQFDDGDTVELDFKPSLSNFHQLVFIEIVYLFELLNVHFYELFPHFLHFLFLVVGKVSHIDYVACFLEMFDFDFLVDTELCQYFVRFDGLLQYSVVQIPTSPFRNHLSVIIILEISEFH